MSSVSDGYGTDGSSTPTMTAVRAASRTVLPTTVGSPCRPVIQKRCVSTAAPSAPGPSSCGFKRRPRTGRSPITSKYEPSTTPARTWRGSPRPTIVKVMVENSPRDVTDFNRPRRSMISGTENAVFSVPIPGALWRM